MNYELRELSTFIKVFPGTNQSRLSKDKKNEISLYDLKAFDEDFKKGTIPSKKKDNLQPQSTIEKGDVIINTSNYLATIVDESNQGKTISTNFLRVAFLNDEVDRTYFMYLFNESKVLQQQKVRDSQGTTTILKLTAKAIESMQIPMIPLIKQQQIGSSYRKLLLLRKQLFQLSESYNDLILSILDKSIQGD